jgi:hypothetical protein
MTSDLNEARTKLYKAFDRALELAETSMSNGDTHHRVAARSRALMAAAQTAQALTQIEHELKVQSLIDEARRNGAEFSIDIGKGVVHAVPPSNAPKIRKLGEGS